MRCNKDGSEFFCHEKDDDTPQKCECPNCHAKPGTGLDEVKREEMPGGFLVTYKCKKCKIEVQCAEPPKPPECKCPKCGNNNVSEFEELTREPMADGKTFQVHYKCKKCGEEFDCLQQDGGGDCKCPTCGKFDATELSREKAMDGPDGEVWNVRYRCNTDSTEFECMETTGKECKCPSCGSKDHEEIGRTTGADGSVTVRFKCKGCGTEYECVEGEGDPAECKCPKCSKHPADAPDEFETLSVTETADGKTKTRYRHKTDGGEFECVDGPGEDEICKCPKCKKTGPFETLSRETTADGKATVTLKCKNCGFQPIKCLEQPGKPCICQECNSGENLEELKRVGVGGGQVIHHKCKLGHSKRDEKCSAGLPDCVVCCIQMESDKPPRCECPQCHATVGKGLEQLESESVKLPDGKTAIIRHMRCTNCGFVSGQCSTGKYVGVEATECISVMGEPPKCPKCGSHDIREIGRRPSESDPDNCVTVKFKCNDCGEEFEVETCKGENPKCPDCGADISVYKKTMLAEKVGIAHMKCPKGHAHPDQCSEHLDNCVLDVPFMENGEGGCKCPCPKCGGCNYRAKGVCRQGSTCVQKVICLVCGEEYTCPADAGEICPYCCSSRNLAKMVKVDASGKPVKEGGAMVVIVYCRSCKKGKVSGPPSTIPEC
jgi:transposase-like protein